MKFENHIIEELISDCPRNDKVDIGKIREMLENIFDNCKYYQEISDYFNTYIRECFNPDKYDWNSPEYDEYWKYVHGINDEVLRVISFYRWVKFVEEDFLLVKGKRRTFDEACKLATNEWCKRLFGNHYQDNGALNEEHSFMACALGTWLKTKANESITEEIIENTRKNLYKYFENHCLYKSKDHPEWEHRIQLYSDYGPNSPLYYILQESGVPEEDISTICPWKTGIEVDETDNSVVISGYQKRDYI